jgi:hypothetical protein
MKPRFRFSFHVVLAAGLLIGALPGLSRGSVVFDQGFDPTGQVTLSAGFGGTNPNQQIAQTFQVGVSGLLTEVDVFVHRFSSFQVGGNVVFEIRNQTSSSLPSNNPADTLVQISIPYSSISLSSGFVKVDTSAANLQFTAGANLAIVLHADTATPSGLNYSWGGENSNPYANGEAYEQVVGNSTWASAVGPNGDLGFMTYMSTSVPEPGTISLSALGLLALIGNRWRRRIAGLAQRS